MRTVLLLSSALVALAPLTAHAEDVAANAPNQAAAASQDSDPNEIIVSARRRDERLQDVPVAVSAVSGEALANAAVSDLARVASLVPSLIIGRAATGSSANIYLRGVGSTSLSSAFDQSVSINMDGIAMSRGREIVTSQFDLQRIEVLKGPQALFFGKNSTGGVITVVTADPTDELEASVRLGYEFEAKEKFGEAMISGPLGQGLSARVAVRGSKMKGYFNNLAQANTTFGMLRQPTTRDLPREESLAGRITFKYDDGGAFNATLKGSFSHFEDGGQLSSVDSGCAAGRTSPLPTSGVIDPNRGCSIDGNISMANIPASVAALMDYARDGNPYTDYNSAYGVLTMNYEAGPVTLSSVTGGYKFTQDDLNTFNGATAGIFVTQHAKYQQFSQELRAISDLEGPLNFTLGAFYAKSKFDFTTAVITQALPFVSADNRYDQFHRLNGYDGESASAFAELRYAPVEQIEISGGARWTHEAKDTFVFQDYTHPLVRAQLPNGARFDDRYREDNVSPQGVISWKPNRDLMVYAAYKEGFKAGGYNTSMVIQAATKKADGEFRSEKAKGFEVGLRSTPMPGLLFNLTAYDYDYNDLQNQIFDPVSLGQRVSNAGTLTTRGVELETNYSPLGSGFEAHANIAYNDARYHDYIATCFGGQKPSEGCSLRPAANGVPTSQDFEDRRPPRAPEWSGRIGASYGVEVGSGLKVTFGSDMSFSSSYYFIDSLRPEGVQKAFQKLDASIRLANEDNGWELSLIGRNLTNELVVVGGADVAQQSGAGGTGTVNGVRSDYTAVLERPRQVYLQFTKKF